MTILIAIPTGGQIHYKFVNCLLELTATLTNQKINFLISINQGSFLPHLRAKILGADIERGEHQVPAHNHEIDYILMLDSDIVFHPDQVLQLINHQKDVVSGYYVYAGEETKPIQDRLISTGIWSEEYFKINKHFQTFTVGELDKKNDLVEVDWIGLGFCLVKRDVFKKIKYPWFSSELVKIDKMVDTTSEDVGFCRKISKAGIKILLDPKLKVGHLKTVIL